MVVEPALNGVGLVQLTELVPQLAQLSRFSAARLDPAVQVLDDRMDGWIVKQSGKKHRGNKHRDDGSMYCILSVCVKLAQFFVQVEACKHENHHLFRSTQFPEIGT